MSINLETPKYTLLYVEDEAPIRMVTKMFLAPYFTEIFEAQDGLEAFQIYEEEKPDMIITDIEMPHLNGLDLCRKIRSQDKETPIIITTAYTSVDYLLEAVSLNLIKYLGKPLKEEEIIEALENSFELLESKHPSVVKLSNELYYDTLNQSLSEQKNIISLSQYQSQLLDILIKNKNRIVSYSEIENEIWYDKVMTADSLRTLVRKTRKLVGKEVIENISKTGYKINLYG
jgi:DNA-binding response OmpR family regulator